MLVCPSCASECPDGSRFCMSCGAKLATRRSRDVERRVVTTLFCDLVDFTRLCEEADPEDIDRFLHEYYAAARGVIEGFGGIVEKFVGDAVLGIFGAPKAHEDDAERAVRAGLRLVELVSDLPPASATPAAVRVGINTGEAIVRLTVDPASGEGLLAGDPVNVASRLQTIARPMQVVVGPETHHLTAHAIHYDALEPRRLKGRSAKVACWVARRPVARTGSQSRRDFSTPFVGRASELKMLAGLFAAARETRSSRFVLIVGEAGQGKSRLLAELARLLDQWPGLMCIWRQGHCSPYAPESAYQPLAEIVREHAGILESDLASVAEEKLTGLALDGPDSDWMLQHLRPLAGLDAPAGPIEERHNAWRRFLQTMARVRPAVLVFEDLHWASEGLMTFLQTLLEDPAPVPLLVICTARPELADDRPSFVAAFPISPPSLARSLRFDLNALSVAETGLLVDGLCKSLGSTETAEMIARRCAGNPMYAEELARWLGEVSRSGEGTPRPEDLGLPPSLKALVGARLDSLPEAPAELLGDAAVVGETFWTGALVRVSAASNEEVAAQLDYLMARELVRPSDSSSIEGEDEYVFWHSLVQEVAYKRLTRDVRVTRHVAAGSWLEERGIAHGPGLQLLAHHLVTALALGRRAHDDDLVTELVEPAVSALTRAGRQALALDVDTAERDLSLAVQNVPDDDARRAGLIGDWAEALSQKGELARAADLYETAAEAHRRAGDTKAAARCLASLSRVLFLLGDARSDATLLRALELVSDDEVSPDKVRVLERGVWRRSIRYEADLAIDAADEVLRLSQRLGMPVPLQALGWRGMARCDLGDRGGLDDMRTALDQGVQRGLGGVSTSIYYNLADEVHAFDGPSAALAIVHEGIDLAQRRGDTTSLLFLRAILVQELSAAGEWDEALRVADDIVPDLERTGQAGDLVPVVLRAAYIRHLQGTLVDLPHLRAATQVERLLDPGERMDCLSILAFLEAAAGDTREARRNLVTIASVREVLPCRLQTGMAMAIAADAAWLAADVGLARRFADGEESRALDRSISATLSARCLEAKGHRAKAARAYEQAGRSWRTFGAPYHEATVLVSAIRCRDRALDPAGRALLERAMRLLTDLGADRDLSEARLLAADATPTSPA